jgi:siroheme synthase
VGLFRWVLRDETSATVRVTQPFKSQQEAEAYLTDSWASLADEGVKSVRLKSGDEVIYDMELGAAT